MLPTPTNTHRIPYFHSYLLGKSAPLDQLSSLPDNELGILDVETLAALNEARHNRSNMNDFQTDEARTEFRRMKVAGYFQAGIKIALDQR